MQSIPDPSNEPTLDSLPASAPAALTFRYQIINQLGKGGMGVVYKAQDRETGAIVALKVLNPEISSRPDLIERFKTELLLARKITHKNICRVYDLNRFENVSTISMEYVEGESLRTLLDRRQGISFRQGLKIVHQIIAGLAEAHAQGVVHRDLKPENILVANDGTVKVMDFGIARSVDTGATLTGTITGTPAYMSPEQASGKTVDSRSDIYSLGLLMYEMFCGERAFTGDTPITVAMKQVREMPPPPSGVEPHIPGFLELAILKCIEKNPAKRFQTAQELEAALTAKQAFVPTVVAGAEPEPPMPVHLSRWQPRDWALVAMAIAGVLLFFPFFQRTSLAPRNQVSFDRSVLRKIAQDYAQRLGARVDQESEIHLRPMLDRYDYVGERSGAGAALELTNNPVTYDQWEVDFGNGTLVAVDHRGSLRFFARDASGAPIEKVTADEAKTFAEKTVREFLGLDPSALPLEATNDNWRGHTATSFTWSETKDYYGLKRWYRVRLLGREIVELGSFATVPQGYERSDSLWQVLPWVVLVLVLLVVGLFQRELVDLYSRWRMAVMAVDVVLTGWISWLTLSGPLRPVVGTPMAMFISIVASLGGALLMFFVLVPVERAIRRSGPAHLSTVIGLFDRRVVSESCGLSILRGTLIGMALLGIDALLVWTGTSYFGMRLDSFALLYLQGRLFLDNPWPGPQLFLYPIFQALAIFILVSFLASMTLRIVRRFWLGLFVAAVLSAAILPGPTVIMGAVQPYHGKVLVLFFEFLILSWAFVRFDVLTLFVAAFTTAFLWQNYTLLVMFKPIGALDEWMTLAIWALFVTAAAAVAFKSSLMAAYRRAASAV